MRRILPLAMAALLCALSAQEKEPAYREPKEEDEDLIPRAEYSFNPLQASREFRVGEFYWKKGSYKAAAGRFLEATKWNPGYAEAFFRLAEARLKMADAEPVAAEKDRLLDSAREAFAQYIELEPKGKRARKARTEISRLERR